MIDDMPQPNLRTFQLPGKRKPLGVVGGMGSLATAKFLEVLAQKSEVEKDQDHIPYITLSLPNISDRSRAITMGSDAPLRQILERAHWLEKAGCGAIAIPCNTAHFWASEIRYALSIELINMIELTRKFLYCTTEKVHDIRTVVLGTNATMMQPLYPGTNTHCFGYDFWQQIIEWRDCTAVIIADVKAGHITRATETLKQLVRGVRSLNPDAIVLGCSELSAISGGLAPEENVVDPIGILADGCIQWWNDSKM
ncbi:amino acid racemase [Mesorhizobium sp. M0854]|uniref:aspartate/glutamate racemase family protein n=1 Tax=Mesorhizobium sp. M0854 TaxID=2957013 RepID=UPI00333B545B